MYLCVSCFCVYCIVYVFFFFSIRTRPPRYLRAWSSYVCSSHLPDSTAFGVVVPDLPGCFSAGDTLDEAVTNAEEAAAAWIDATLDAGQPIPRTSSLDGTRGNPDEDGGAMGELGRAAGRAGG